jgi:hypothetical protein
MFCCDVTGHLPLNGARHDVGCCQFGADDQSDDEKNDRCLTTRVWVVSPTTRNRPTNVQAICSAIVSLVSKLFLFSIGLLSKPPPLLA